MMRESKKAERIKILGAEVDPVRVDRAITMTSRLLEQNRFDYIVFVNTSAAILGQEQEQFARFLNDAALVLPGDKNIENAMEENLKIEEDATYQSEYCDRLFYRLNRMGSSVYLFQEKEEELNLLLDIFHDRYGRIQVEGSLWQEEENLDNLVNSINILAPDILLIGGNLEWMEGFWKEYGSKINASLCICMEEMTTDNGRRIPDWVRNLHLEGIYCWLFEKPKHLWKDSIFKKRMKESDLEQQEAQEEQKIANKEEKEE
ncbi:MAG: WecB/TagA/CpsF family glycosyltransferase [Lachnospiraceae bacterium]|nr:WecB/TagA/CpsF family glycosyltransferase [Lachnospiraceae bacterium]